MKREKLKKIIKNTNKDISGITLVALVVTIIVLIILAGVSISLVLGNNGIVTKAKLAKEQTEQAKLNEEEQLNSAIDYIETLGENPKEVNYAPYDNPYIPDGFTHIEGTTWNNGFTIKGVEQNVNDEFVWVPCVTDQSKVKEGDTVVTFGRILPKTTVITDIYYKYNQEQLTDITDGDSSAQEIRKSVEKYGGFYIAKYEAGVNGTTENYSLTTKTPITEKPLSQAGKGVWNYITRSDAIIVSKAMVNQVATGVKSTLISGEAWDTTLQWIVNASENGIKNNEPNKNYDINSKGKGWYSETTSNNTRHITGYYPVNNIYDMAGNVWEWTTENCKVNGGSGLVIRGGIYDRSGSDRPAAYRFSIGNVRGFSVAFRVLLYK